LRYTIHDIPCEISSNRSVPYVGIGVHDRHALGTGHRAPVSPRVLLWACAARDDVSSMLLPSQTQPGLHRTSPPRSCAFGGLEQLCGSITVVVPELATSSFRRGVPSHARGGLSPITVRRVRTGRNSGVSAHRFQGPARSTPDTESAAVGLSLQIVGATAVAGQAPGAMGGATML